MILHNGWTRTSSPFTRLRTRRSKSLPFHSSYRTDEDKISFRAISYWTDEFPRARFLVPNRRCQACLIHRTVLTRSSPPFTRLHTGWTKSRLLDSSYQMDENMPSIHATSYRMDEVPPTLLLVPDGRGQALLSHDFVSDGRSPTWLIPHTGQPWTSSPHATPNRTDVVPPA